MKKPLDLSSFTGTITQLPYAARAAKPQEAKVVQLPTRPKTRWQRRVIAAHHWPSRQHQYPSYVAHSDALRDASLRFEPLLAEFGEASDDVLSPNHAPVYSDFQEHDRDNPNAGPTIPHPQVAGPAELWEEIEDHLLAGDITMDDVLELRIELHSTINHC